MVLYRIAKCIYADDLSGTGARLYGGRWNSEGKAAVYLASSRALAMLEVLVHLPPLLVPNDFCIIEVEVPDNSTYNLPMESLPANWKDIRQPIALRKIGDEFLKKQDLLLMKIPSAIVPEEFNFMLNPQHSLIKQVQLLRKNTFSFDERLV